jgi:hypothetical protein
MVSMAVCPVERTAIYLHDGCVVVLDTAISNQRVSS